MATPSFQLASAPLPQATALPRGPHYCHTGPATWPVISGQGEGEVKPDWGGLCVANPQTSLLGLATPCGLPSFSAQPRLPTPHPTTSPSPRTGQALATPRLHPKGEVVLTAPPVQYSPFSHRKPSP